MASCASVSVPVSSASVLGVVAVPHDHQVEEGFVTFGSDFVAFGSGACFGS